MSRNLILMVMAATVAIFALRVLHDRNAAVVSCPAAACPIGMMELEHGEA